MIRYCKFCNREFINNNGVYAHQVYCDKNPNKKMGHFTGKKHSIDAKRKQAKSYKRTRNPRNLKDVSSRTVQKILKRLKLGCSNCGWDLAGLDVHHIVSKRKGGSNEDSNLSVLCPNCHRLAHAGILITLVSIKEQVGDAWRDHYYSCLSE